MKDVLSKSEQILALSRELLDDIELGRLKADVLLLKAGRLARWTDANETYRKWIEWETRGYSSDELAIQWMDYVGRWTNRAAKLGHWGPLAEIDASIEAAQLRLRMLRIPDIDASEYVHSSNPNQYVKLRESWDPSPGKVIANSITQITNDGVALSQRISQLTSIRSRVLGALHAFVSSAYHEKAFSGLASNIFESYQRRIDPLIADRSGDVLERIPAINARLIEGDNEAISQALNTCRRIIDGFADAIYPPTDSALNLDGQAVELNAKNTKARIIAYVGDRSTSKSTRKKLRQTLNNLYERISSGVHNDVSIEEAQSLFVETYLLLGQVLDLGDIPAPSVP